MDSSDPADWPTDDIVAAILDGEIEEFRHLVRRYQSAVAAIAHATLGDSDQVADLVQQVFIRAFENLDQFDQEKSFSLWIKGIARNVVREELRKKFRYRGRLEKYSRLWEERLTLQSGRDCFTDDSRNALEECIRRLDESAARAVLLHYFEQRKTEEIGELLGRKSGAIRTLLHRARIALRDCLVNKGVVS